VSERERLVIIGGDAGGMSAAAQARRRAPTDKLDILVFEKGDFTSYGACGLPYYVAGHMDDPEELVSRTPEEHRANGIDVRMRHEVVGVDLEKRVVRVRDVDAGTERSEAFDQLVFANGAEPIRPPLPGVDAEGVHGIQTIGDGIALREHVVREHTGDRAVVVGGGYIGLEMAEAMHERGMIVTVVDANSQPMSTLDEDMGELVAAAIRKIGLELRTETRVQAFGTDTQGHVQSVVTEHGTIPADIVVLGIGVKPSVGMARDAGVEIGPSGGVKTDRRMATSVPGVWAAGDCVETFHRVSHLPVTIALGTHANKQGRVVAENATGGYATFAGVIGTAITRVCAYEIGRTGLNEKEAREAGFEFVAATIESTTRAHYFEGSPEITVRVLAEKRSRRLLGAQIIGREGAAKRVDVMAAAIWNEMTVDEFVQLDLGYAPPFSPVWDSTLIAARKAASML
jgi:NADPH-dependent 2,4-dienoyl-CoA reductase/sulfur reductase-like enzyme